MAFTENQQTFAWFALLFSGVFFAVIVYSHVTTSPFPDGITTTGTVTGIETRGDGITSKKTSTTLVQFENSQGVSQQGKLPAERLRVGRRLKISYRPEDPASIRHLNPEFTPTQLKCSLIVCAVAFFASLVVLIPSRLNRVTEKHEPLGKMISPAQTAALIGFVVVALAVGVCVSESQRTVEVQAEVVSSEQPNLEAGQRVYVTYNQSNGDIGYAWMDTDSEHQVGDKLMYSYTPPLAQLPEILGRFPWVQNGMMIIAVPLLILLMPNSLKKQTSRDSDSENAAGNA